MKQQEHHPPVVLEPEQYETLTQLATQQHRTISEVALEVVRLGLASLAQKRPRQLGH